MRSRRVVGWVFGLVLLSVAIGCAEADDSVVAGGGSLGTPDGPAVGSGDGLALRIAGSVEAELLCPGGRTPCLPFSGAVEPSATGDAVWVGGRLVDGVFVIAEQRPFPDPFGRDYSNRCADDDLAAAPSEVVEAMHEGLEERPPGYADLWDSDGILHLGVAGDGAEAIAFLEELGFSDAVCVVPGFPFADELLESAQSAVANTLEQRGIDGFGVSRDAWNGTITLDVPFADRATRAVLDEISAEHDDVPIIMIAGVEVVDGGVDDYDAALATVEGVGNPADQLTARCGVVEFASIPPDLGQFPPLDADAEAALDELVNGPTGVEASGFDVDYEWSIAARTDSELVLLGQRDQPDEGTALVSARFDRRDGAWSPSGWGGCRVQIDAPGFGSASVAIESNDASDPDSTELDLLIQERACASGQAPVDRQVEVIAIETSDSVTIVALVEPVAGDADCPGNPWHPVSVSLAEPLGSRQLLDGSSSPAVPVGPPD